MHEFKVNDFITLRLEGKDTVIYVAGEQFQQCKYILINIPKDEIKKFANIDSIDEVITKKKAFNAYYKADVTSISNAFITSSIFFVE